MLSYPIDIYGVLSTLNISVQVVQTHFRLQDLRWFDRGKGGNFRTGCPLSAHTRYELDSATTLYLHPVSHQVWSLHVSNILDDDIWAPWSIEIRDIILVSSSQMDIKFSADIALNHIGTYGVYTVFINSWFSDYMSAQSIEYWTWEVKQIVNPTSTWR